MGGCSMPPTPTSSFEREKGCPGEAQYLLFSLLTFWKVSSTAGPTHLTSK